MSLLSTPPCLSSLNAKKYIGISALYILIRLLKIVFCKISTPSKIFH
nr:MAG TPA: hypothetical protein [Bacteriophage sp.]